MRGITIIKDSNRIHTGDDLDLIQEVKEIDPPTIQSYFVEVPGRNGLLNLTKGLTGDVTYKNRSLKFQYLAIGKREDLLDIADLFNRYHGEIIKIIDDDTPDYYYEGEASVTTSCDNTLLTISLEIDADPFRKNLEITTVSTTLNNDVKHIIINNQGVSVSPTIEVTKEVNIIINDNTYTLNAGKYTISKLELKTGSTVIQASGSGVLKIQYREARL